MNISIRKIVLGATLACSLSGVAQTLPYQDPSLSIDQRVDDLLGRLTIEEKAKLMMNSSPAIPRLGIKQFDWWSEALHGVGRNGITTVFPSCIGLSCSFDDQLIRTIYDAVSDEARAKHNILRRNGLPAAKYQCLSFWTPNINVFRDPRWGRGQETYGEDPYMNGRMGSQVVLGLQGLQATDAQHPYYKLLACAKHFAVHSGPEATRHRFDIENLPPRDLWETYLPAFKTLVKDANVQEVMCAYQRFEGDPCCGSNRLLQQILRDEWGFDGLVVSDCGAVSDFYVKGRHEVSADAPAASAKAVLSGTDVECGSVYKNLPKAVERGDISEADLDVSMRRLLKGRFLLGDFDDPSLVEWTSIPETVISSPEHRKLALEAAREQMVLLKNDGVLPLKRDAKVMVMGPNAADSLVMWGIYYGEPAHTVTALEGMEAKVGHKLPYTKGCDIAYAQENESVFSRFVAPDGGKGMIATYWNNTRMEGEPAATLRHTVAPAQDNGGNTAFAPGVNLTNFSATYKGTFVAEKSETLNMIYNNDDGLRIIINGDTVHNRWRSDPLAFRNRNFKVKAGESYDIQVDYMQLDGTATMNFDIQRNNPVTPAEVVARAKDVDVVVFVGGISPNLEREEANVTAPGFDHGDRTSIELPQVQRDLIKALHKAGKKVVLVCCSGSAVALTNEHNETCNAILEAWYAGEQGGHAIADVLYGDYNPSGKLTVTFYKDDSQLPAFDDYLMANRTYRYFSGEPLYHFGYGLSYTTFSIGKPKYKNGKVVVKVKNTGEREGTEVVQVYVRDPLDVNGPKKTLRGYTRVSLKAGEERLVEVNLPRESFELWDASTNTMRVTPGKKQVLVGSSSLDSDLQAVTVKVKELR